MATYSQYRTVAGTVKEGWGALGMHESGVSSYRTMSLVDEGNRSKNKAVCVNVSEKRPFSFAESHRAAWRTCGRKRVLLIAASILAARKLSTAVRRKFLLRSAP